MHISLVQREWRTSTPIVFKNIQHFLATVDAVHSCRFNQGGETSCSQAGPTSKVHQGIAFRTNPTSCQEPTPHPHQNALVRRAMCDIVLDRPGGIVPLDASKCWVEAVLQRTHGSVGHWLIRSTSQSSVPSLWVPESLEHNPSSTCIFQAP